MCLWLQEVEVGLRKAVTFVVAMSSSRMHVFGTVLGYMQDLSRSFFYTSNHLTSRPGRCAAREQARLFLVQMSVGVDMSGHKSRRVVVSAASTASWYADR